jgi:uncharacterized protein YqgV (UPF0045/DUF77 family)
MSEQLEERIAKLEVSNTKIEAKLDELIELVKELLSHIVEEVEDDEEDEEDEH